MIKTKMSFKKSHFHRLTKTKIEEDDALDALLATNVAIKTVLKLKQRHTTSAAAQAYSCYCLHALVIRNEGIVCYALLSF